MWGRTKPLGSGGLQTISQADSLPESSTWSAKWASQTPACQAWERGKCSASQTSGAGGQAAPTFSLGIFRTVNLDTAPFDYFKPYWPGTVLELPFIVPFCVYLQIPGCLFYVPVPRHAPIRLTGDKYLRTTRDTSLEHPLIAGTYFASHQCFRQSYFWFKSLSALEPVRWVWRLSYWEECLEGSCTLCTSQFLSNWIPTS